MCDLSTLDLSELRDLRKKINKEIVARHPKGKKVPGVKMRRYRLYVLMLEKGKFYVGMTSQRVDRRLSQHMSGKGAIWTNKYKPIGILEVIELGYCSESDAALKENEKAREVMALHGTSNVRGGDMCYIEGRLSPSNKLGVI